MKLHKSPWKSHTCGSSLRNWCFDVQFNLMLEVDLTSRGCQIFIWSNIQLFDSIVYHYRPIYWISPAWTGSKEMMSFVWQNSNLASLPSLAWPLASAPWWQTCLPWDLGRPVMTWQPGKMSTYKVILVLICNGALVRPDAPRHEFSPCWH